jgi:cytochrome c oxidase subunit 2
MRQKATMIVALVVAAIVVVAVLVYAAVRFGGSHRAADPVKTQDLEPSGKLVDGVRVINITARRFEFEPSTVVVREGERVRLLATSADVTHGLAIADYGVNATLEPEKTQTIEFTADKPGKHDFQCSVYCGSGHGRMRGELVVVNKEP